jgi:hypothetical protein
MTKYRCPHCKRIVDIEEARNILRTLEWSAKYSSCTGDIRNERHYNPWGYVAVICAQIWAAF